jgi:integrase/recombinase XerD
MDELLNSYMSYLKNKNLSKNTLDAYKRDIKKFCQFLNSRNEGRRDNYNGLCTRIT